MEQVQLRAVAEEAGFVDREIFEQLRQLAPSGVADQQPVVAVEGIHAAFLETPQQPVLQKMRAALVEVHAALLVHERLQKFQFRFGKNGGRCRA